ncbi:hypothetical protein CCACVL1_27332 [Corchorus capsularis]|uniref:Uncharacterized protein n=1 Tax=Corchorus capsularis TaxID=210143 RepID=A0A1R3GAY5_COCAP|nr:hypothetical protein CCACVL1_27332 [Corchorus capsularis]
MASEETLAAACSFIENRTIVSELQTFTVGPQTF